MQPLGGELQPAQARSTTAQVGQRPPDSHRVTHRSEVGGRASQARAADPVDRDQVAAVEGGDLVDDRTLRLRPTVTSFDTDLDHVARLESVEAVKARGSPMRRDGVGMGRQRSDHQALEPRR
jgi:hypothetical protein